MYKKTAHLLLSPHSRCTEEWTDFIQAASLGQHLDLRGCGGHNQEILEKHEDSWEI